MRMRTVKDRITKLFRAYRSVKPGVQEYRPGFNEQLNILPKSQV